MFKNVIAIKPCPSIKEGVTTSSFGKPDYTLALKQHEAYIDALRKCDVEVTLLEANDGYPDSCFVEDVALCTKRNALITRPGVISRCGEAELPDLRIALEDFYKDLDIIKEPGTVDAGDIMMVGDHFYIGLSGRTNEDGAKQVITLLEKYGFTGSTIELKEGLHLKTGLSYIENNNLLVTGGFVNNSAFSSFKRIEIDSDEAYAANSVWVNGKVITPEGYPKTKIKIENLGYTVLTVDTSEFKKIDGGLSCLSLRF